MSNKIFISGSISLKHLPEKVRNESLCKIIQNNLTVLVGDADGIDKLIQQFFYSLGYLNVKVYSISEQPRNLMTSSFLVERVNVSNNITKERERQSFKDIKMTQDSDYSLVVWDGKSKGSFNNIIRAIESKKTIKVFLTSIDDFIPKEKVNINEIKYIYYENNGYTASEIVDYLKEDGIEDFRNTRDLNKYLLDNNIIIRNNNIYEPLCMQNLFIIEKYQGKNTGIKFKNNFIDWLKEMLSRESLPSNQGDLFA